MKKRLDFLIKCVVLIYREVIVAHEIITQIIEKACYKIPPHLRDDARQILQLSALQQIRRSKGNLNTNIMLKEFNTLLNRFRKTEKYRGVKFAPKLLDNHKFNPNPLTINNLIKVEYYE